MNIVKQINICEVCGNKDLSRVLDLGEHPLCDDLKPINANMQCQHYPIKVLFCNVCKTAHQEYQVAKKDLFPNDYHYRARFTKDVLNGMQQLVADACAKAGTLN